ncbi:MAG: hypothetical protein DMG59_26675 [Acidobacteria bacterium]|nr:MAG: hypothetical protein DMG59_26675 [Acidobacteriota bacterium]
MTFATRPQARVVVLAPAAAARGRFDVLGFLATAYAALLPYQFEVSHGRLNFAPADLCLPLAILLAPAYLKYRREAWSFLHITLLLIFAASSFLVALETGRLIPYVLVNKDVGLLALFVAYLIITSAMTSWARIRQLLRVFVQSVVFQNLVGIAAFFAANVYGIITPLTSFGGRRLCGMMLDANAYAGLLVAALILSEAASYGPAPLFNPGFLLFSRATLGLGILFTFSRSAWVSLGLAFIFFFAVRFRKAVRALFVVAAGVGLVLIFAGQGFLTLLISMTVRPEATHGLAVTREELIQRGLVGFAQHPWFGAGIGTFIETQGTIVHNSPIWFLAEFGLIGFAVFAGFVSWFLLKGLRTYRLAPVFEKPVVLGLILAHVAMLGLSMGIEAFYQRHWWLIFALIASSYDIARRRAQSMVRSQSR